MDEKQGPQDKYVLPFEYQELISQRSYSKVSVYGLGRGEFSEFIVWLHKPISEVRQRAEAFIHKLYGREAEYSVFPRNYVRDSLGLARLGMHEDAPLEVCQRILRLYRDRWAAYERYTEQQRAREEARLAHERANPQLEETGTYLGPVVGTSLCVWRDQYGYTHAASEWMLALSPGQKFISGSTVMAEGSSELAPLKGAVAAATGFDLSEMLAAGDARQVAGAQAGHPRILVLTWQGTWPLDPARGVHQDGDPWLEAAEFGLSGTLHVVGGCAASLFDSIVTKREALSGVLRAWGLAEDALDEVHQWLHARVEHASHRSLARSWPLSRMAMPTLAELADLGERRVTLYAQSTFGLGRVRLEATHLQVWRGRYAQYTDAFFVRFKPRDSRQLRQHTETYAPDLVVLLGWGHPDLQEQLKKDGYNTQRTKYASCDSRWEKEFDAALRFYLETHPLTRVVLDLRGEDVHGLRSDEADAATRWKNIPPALDRPVTTPLAFSAPREPKIEAPVKTRLFVSYHHSRDGIHRSRFEQDFHASFLSVSVYPGEIDARRSDAAIKRDIRARIAECECLIVLVSATTHLRRWVDYEIRTALDEKLPGGPRPVVGLLVSELLPAATAIRAEIDAARSTCLPPVCTNRIVQRLSDTLGAQMLAARGYAIPTRLLDNLLVGQAVLATWPDDIQHLNSLVIEGHAALGRPLNLRALMRTDHG